MFFCKNIVWHLVNLYLHFLVLYSRQYSMSLTKDIPTPPKMNINKQEKEKKKKEKNTGQRRGGRMSKDTGRTCINWTMFTG